MKASRLVGATTGNGTGLCGRRQPKRPPCGHVQGVLKEIAPSPAPCGGRRRVDPAVEARILRLKASGDGVLNIGRKLGICLQLRRTLENYHRLGNASSGVPPHQFCARNPPSFPEAAATEEAGGAGADHAAAADRDAHEFSADEPFDHRVLAVAVPYSKRISQKPGGDLLGCIPEICCTGPLPRVMGDRKEAYNV
jgi:hypothetical protein